MKSFYALRTTVLAVAALAIVASGSLDALAAGKRSRKDWDIRGQNGTVMTNTMYALYNTTSKKHIMEGEGRIGNYKLKWDNEQKPRFEFVKIPREKSPSPLKFGDKVAIALPGTTLFQGKPAPTYLM